MNRYSCKERVARYFHLERLSNSGLWEIDVLANTLIWSDGMYEIFEISKDIKDVDLTELINSKVHPDDRERVNLTLKESFATGNDYHIIHRILLNDSRIKYIKGKAVCKKNEDGVVVNMIGSAVDITTEKILENELKEKNSELERQNQKLNHSISHYDLRAEIEAIIQHKKSKTKN